ncbi:MAG TPA: tetratricopeptide repeat protein [Candidatus Angelobacter sp.]|nr:tetratricopeptide repeat protein [Candidatus Angelobacter sp.]
MRHIYRCILAMLFCGFLTIPAFAQETATPASTALRRSPENAVKSKASFDSLLQSAEAGNVAAMMDVATAYNYGLYKGKNGFDLAQDTGQALAWYQKAATQGYAPAQNNLGDLYWRGWGGVQKDDSQAITWYRKAAVQGYAPAQNSLGYFYQNGWGGVPKDDSQALAWYQKAAAQGYDIAKHNLSSPDIVAMLEQAKNEKLQLSRAEKSALKSYHKDSLKDLEYCNQNDYYNTHSVQDTSRSCSSAAGALKNSIGVSSRATELAYLRSCSFRGRFGGIYDSCPDLGQFYEERGDYAMAMAVYLHAPNCDQPQPYTINRESCLMFANILSQKLGDKPLEATVTKDLCQRFSDSNYCFSLNRYFHGSVDLDVAAERSRAIQNREERALDAEEAAELQEHLERQQERDAKWNAATSTLQSMPGANDPNAILNAANQQSAQMMAIGAANDAARQQAALQQQAQAAQRAQARLSQQQNAATSNHSSATSSAGSSASTSSNSGSANGAGASGNSPASTTSTAHYATPLPGSCIGSFLDPKYYNWLSFQNNCGQAIRLVFVSKSTSNYWSGAKDLAPGQAGNTGWSQSDVDKMGGFTVFVCPAGYLAVDAFTDQGITRSNQEFRCKQQ